MDCRGLTKRLNDVWELADLLDRHFEGETDELILIQNRIDSLLKEIMKEVDPDRLFERTKLAKELSFDYVGPVTPDGIAAVGIRFGQDAKDIWTFDNFCLLIDVETGSPVPEPFDKINPFHRGSAWAVRKRQFGPEKWQVDYDDYLIDEKGNILYSRGPNYHTPGGSELYHGSPICIESKTNKEHDRFFVTSKGGKIIFGKTSERRTHFSDGVYWGRESGKYALFDEEGNQLFVLDRDFDTLGSFSEGYCLAYEYVTDSETKSDVYLIDKQGKYKKIDNIEIDEKRDDWSGEKILDVKFQNGYAVGRNQDGWFLYDKDGGIINLYTFWPWEVLAGGKVVGQGEGGYQAIFDFIHKKFISEKHKRIERFKDGAVKVQKINGKWNFLNEDGTLVNETDYEEAMPFSEGLAWVRDNIGWTAIGRNGQGVFTGDNVWFKSLVGEAGGLTRGAFYGGVVAVEDFEGNQFFVDKRGKRVFS